MRLVWLLILSCSSMAACQNTPPEKSTPTPSTPIKIYDQFADLEPIFQHDNDTTYLINFWATWCKPCVEELPYIEQLHEDFSGEKLKIILVSLDFPQQIESHLLPFIKKEQLKSEVVVLTDGDVNTWIPQVEESWGGAIPVSVLYQGEHRTFIGEALENYEQIQTLVNDYINR